MSVEEIAAAKELLKSGAMTDEQREELRWIIFDAESAEKKKRREENEEEHLRFERECDVEFLQRDDAAWQRTLTCRLLRWIGIIKPSVTRQGAADGAESRRAARTK